MSDKKLGRIIKGVGGTYWVDTGGEVVPCKSRKTVKTTLGNIMIGDIAVLSKSAEEYVIESLQKRGNSLDRPPVSNINKVLLLVSNAPTPDFYLLDKMVVSLAIKEIECIILVTKSDQDTTALYEKIKENYSNQVKGIYQISSRNSEDVEFIKGIIRGSLTCLVGQSAVGKTSLINALSPKAKYEVGELSKINRGRHTTRHSEVISLGDNTYVIDTPGFSFLDLNINPEHLKKYYYDFNQYIDNCQFRSCNHVDEVNCGVKVAIENGEISQDRYDRYITLYNELKTKWRKKYG